MSNDFDYVIVKTTIECWYEQIRKVRPDLAQPEQMLTVLKYLDKKKSSNDFSNVELLPDFPIDLKRKFKVIDNEICYQRYIARRTIGRNPYAIVLHPKDYDNLAKSRSAQADLVFKPDGNLRYMGMKIVTHNAMEENKIKFAFSQGEVDAFLQELERRN